MDWYVVDKNYSKFLETIDSKVGFVEYGSKVKLHIGVCKINKYNYYIPVSSYKRKHANMSNSMDFHKIQNSANGFVYAILNINNMIPVPDKYISQVKYNEIEKYRTFSNEKEKVDYIYLLQLEKAIIDSIEETIKNKAASLYSKFIQNPKSRLSKRCCDFTLLESASSQYHGILSEINIAVTNE